MSGRDKTGKGGGSKPRSAAEFAYDHRNVENRWLAEKVAAEMRAGELGLKGGERRQYVRDQTRHVKKES